MRMKKRTSSIESTRERNRLHIAILHDDDEDSRGREGRGVRSSLLSPTSLSPHIASFPPILLQLFPKYPITGDFASLSMDLSLSLHSWLHLFSLYLCMRVCVCARMRAEIHYCRRCSTTRSCDRVTSVDRRRRRRCCCCCYRLSSNCPVSHRSFMPNLFQHNRTAVAFVCPVSSCCLVPSFLPVRTESMIGSIHALHGGSDGAPRRAQKERRKWINK